MDRHSIHLNPTKVYTYRTSLPRNRQSCRVHRLDPKICSSAKTNTLQPISDTDLKFLKRAVIVSKTSEGLYQPHPNHGCILVNKEGTVISETHQKARGTLSAECQALSQVKEEGSGATAYLNIEPGHSSSLEALSEGKVERVVIGMKNPLPHISGSFIKKLLNRGIDVDVLGSSLYHTSDEDLQEVFQLCLESNEPLLHRCVTGKPFSVLKYAMTLDGKIAASTGHSAWVSSPIARKQVFATRAVSDAVIVGGNTVRKDNPNLTTRKENGFCPTRIVMSRTMDLPYEANLWNVEIAPTIVFTQRGARSEFQHQLKEQGVEIVEFDFLTPSAVVNYCYHRGFLQLLWECGGTLSAPALSSNVIHKVLAFIAPKIIGGDNSPNPCGDLGFVEMTQAVELKEMKFTQTGPDIMLSGYLPASGGLSKLAESLNPSSKQQEYSTQSLPSLVDQKKEVIKFYSTWEKWGDLSNFTVYPIRMFEGAGPHGQLPSSSDTNTRLWSSVEHYYQSQKFAGNENSEVKEIVDKIHAAESAEEAAKIGRGYQALHPECVRSDWSEHRIEIMKEVLKAKFISHKIPRKTLLSMEHLSSIIIEDSPHDFFWGGGFDGTGENQLGKLLMSLREELILEISSFSDSNNSSTHLKVPS